MKEIRELLNKYLLRGDMDEIYRKLETDKITYVDFEILNEQFRKWKDLGCSNFQIDLPLLISENEKKAGKRIMIIGQDPNNDGKTDNEGVILNTPYSFLAQEENAYNKILNALKGEYEFYLTDLYKMFFWFKRDLKMDRNDNISLQAKSHQLPTYTFEAIHYTMLREEINIVKPDLIVTFGDPARHAVRLIAPNKFKYKDSVTKDKILLRQSYEFELDGGKRIKYAPLPHPSNSVRQSSWNKFFTENEISATKRVEGVVEVIRKLL